MNMQTTIATQIAKLRRENTLTQAELAEKLGITAQAVSQWERSETMPDIMTLPRLAGIFHCSIDMLYGLAPVEETDETDENSGDEWRAAVLHQGRIVESEKLPMDAAAAAAAVTLHISGPLVGDIRSDFSVRIDGAVNGNISALEQVTVQGNITGDVQATDSISVHRDIYGNVEAAGNVQVEGCLAGDVKAAGTVRVHMQAAENGEENARFDIKTDHLAHIGRSINAFVSDVFDSIGGRDHPTHSPRCADMEEEAEHTESEYRAVLMRDGEILESKCIPHQGERVILQLTHCSGDLASAFSVSVSGDVEGDVQAQGEVQVEGDVDGDVQTLGEVQVEGDVDGDVNGDHIEISGDVAGDVQGYQIRIDGDVGGDVTAEKYHGRC